MGSTLPTLNFLTSSDDYSDYRPAVDSTGELVVFERTHVGSDQTLLNGVFDFSAPQARPFLTATSAAPLPPTQTRPDWCWKTGALLFNGSKTNKSQLSVWYLASIFSAPVEVPGTARCAYPTWSLGGTSFVTENGNGNPGPCNTTFDTGGTQILGNVDGTDAFGVALFGGMPTVAPGDLPLIAFAGQPASAIWGGSSVASYDEDKNYIFQNVPDGDSYFSSPIELGAPVAFYDPAFQARAPAWSPNGSTIAFESNRRGNGYAIYLCDLTSGAITQVTDPALGGQHAKFFPDGGKLILCIHHPGGSPRTMGIAWVDISGLLKA